MSRSLVIVRDLDVVGVAPLPTKADPPLLVHTNAVLTASVPREPFQAVSGRHPEIVQCVCGIHEQQLSVRSPLHVRREPPRSLSLEDLLRLPIAKAPNHRQ
jgi:hypothetical protein